MAAHLSASRRAAGKSDNHFHTKTLGQQNGFAKALGVAGGMFCVRVNGIAVATERGYLNSAILKFFLPGLGLGGVSKEFVDRTMMGSGIAAGSNLHRFESECAYLIQHFVQRKLFVDGVEDADGNFALRCRWDR